MGIARAAKYRLCAGNWTIIDQLSCIARRFGVHEMSKEQKSNKEAKKKAVLTPKEKKAAKKARKEAKRFSID